MAVRPSIRIDSSLGPKERAHAVRAMDLLSTTFSVFRNDRHLKNVPRIMLSVARAELREVVQSDGTPEGTRAQAVSLIRRVERIAERKGIVLKEDTAPVTQTQQQ